MGSVRKRTLGSGKTRYYPRVKLDGKDQTFGGFRTRREAEARLRLIEMEIASGTFGVQADIRFDEFVSSWLASKEKSLKHSTYVDYEQVFRNHVMPTFSSRKISAILPVEIQDWVNMLSAKGMSPATLSKCYRYLRACLRQAEAWETIPRSPCRSILLPRINRQELDFLRPQDIPLLLEKSPEPEKLLYAVLGMGGLRLGEALALAWRHVSFTNRTISIERAWSYSAGDYQDPKTRSSRRAVPMMPLLAEMLYEHRGESDALLFSHDGEKPLDMCSVGRVFKRSLREAGLRIVTVHSLRHTFSSSLLASGASVKALQAALGHSSATMTLNVYTHLIPEDLGSSILLAGELFSGEKGRFVALPGGTWGAEVVACTAE